MIDISRDEQNQDDDADANRDPLTGAPGAHPVGTGLGSAGGAGAGAAIGALAGPIGAGVGAVIGGIAGGLAGKGAGEAANPTDPESYIGCVVVDRDNDRIGTVESVWHDVDGLPAFLAIKTGWLGLGQAHLVPAEAAEWASTGRKIRLPYDDDVVKAAPAFASEDELDDAGEGRIYEYWRGFGLSGLPTTAGQGLSKVGRSEASSPTHASEDEASELARAEADRSSEVPDDDEIFVPLRRG